MMSVPLTRNAMASDAVHALTVTLQAQPAGGLALRYHLDADAAQLNIPPRGAARFADALWRHTCFELFVSPAIGETAYREFNFSPSLAWAAYQFADYRSGMTPLRLAKVPSMSVEPNGLSLTVAVAAEALGASGAAPMQLGLAAVIESRDGSLSYWALKHTAAQPDFHHRESFSLQWPQPGLPAGSAA